MTNKSDFISAIEKALAESPADESEILAFQSATGLTRVANSEIHQNVAEKNSAISVRVIVDNRIGVSGTNRPDADALKRTIDTAVTNAKVAPRRDDWPGLPENPVIRDDNVSSATEACTPGKRAEMFQHALTLAKNNKLNMAGALETGVSRIYVGNNHSGVSESSLSEVNFNTVLMALDSSGYAAWIGNDLANFNISALSETAAKKALSGRKPTGLAPGSYTVILEPAAVADMLGFLGYVGLGALSVQEKRSFMTDMCDKKIIDEKITLWDDGNDPRTMGATFDFEGVPKQKVVFFERGIAREIVYDTNTAARALTQSTGHALPAPNTHGPLPTNLFLGQGDTGLDEMIAETKKGILVTRFHYTNIEEPMRAVITGMTRDGTFLIENGEIISSLKNLRFTQSILDALNSVVTLGRDAELIDSFLGTCHCPALKVDDFNFTGISE